MSWRTTVQEKDLAGFTRITATEYGAMVIGAGRGLVVPKLCQTEDDVIAFAGKPSLTYPEILDAIDYVSVAPLWLSAPFDTDALYGGVDIKASSVVGFTVGRDLSTASYATTKVRETVGTGDGIIVTFNKTLTHLAYVNQSCTKMIRTTSTGVVTNITVTCSDLATEVLSGTGLTTGSQLIRSSGALTLVFTGGAVPAVGETIEVVYEYVANDVSHSIYALSPCSDTWLAITLAKVAGAAGEYTLTLYEKDSNGNYSILDSLVYSLVAGTKDANGKPIYIDNILLDHPYITYKINASYTGGWGAFTVTSQVDLTGGDRGATIDGTIRNVGWSYFEATKYPVNLFIETSADATVAPTIVDLVTVHRLYSFGLLPLPYGLGSAATVISTKAALSITTDQVAFYCNWGLVLNKYTNGYVWSSMIGRIAAKMGAMAPVYDALAPAGIDENGYGGQIGSGIKDLELDLSDLDQESLDDAEINPIIYSPKYGYYIGGDRTANSLLTDTSYIGTRRLMNLIIRTVKEDILLLQEFKFNDPYHRQSFENKVNIAGKPILDNGYCRELVPVCDNTTVNSDAVMERREFAAWIVFKATPNSQRIVLTFIRIGQTVNVGSFIPQ